MALHILTAAAAVTVASTSTKTAYVSTPVTGAVAFILTPAVPVAASITAAVAKTKTITHTVATPVSTVVTLATTVNLFTAVTAESAVV